MLSARLIMHRESVNFNSTFPIFHKKSDSFTLLIDTGVSGQCQTIVSDLGKSYFIPVNNIIWLCTYEREKETE